MTTIHLVIFGLGNVGSTLLHQIESNKSKLMQQEGIKINIPVIANSKRVLYNTHNSKKLHNDFNEHSVSYVFKDILSYVKSQQFTNLIAIDVTSSLQLTDKYEVLIDNGFSIVTANKIANTRGIDFYNSLREKLRQKNKFFLYETNVGAGLPVIDTVKQLCRSGEKIKKIRGVFSGSLSYIFNRFSEEDIPFTEIIKQAYEDGLTEPDPRDDLSGQDVARKLLILARELGFQNEMASINVEALVPKSLNGKTTISQFNKNINLLNPIFDKRKLKQNQNTVLRYISELDVVANKMGVKLVLEPKNSAIGQLENTDTIFEIYTESYAQSPLVIKGAGAGNEVTARGLLTDILKIAHQLN